MFPGLSSFPGFADPLLHTKIGTPLLSLTLLAIPQNKPTDVSLFYLQLRCPALWSQKFSCAFRAPILKKTIRGRFFESNLKLKFAQRLFCDIFKSKLMERYEILKVLLSKGKSPFVDTSILNKRPALSQIAQ